ncbi:18866_t:CDS:2, partial [Rhizophagus irregularis]
KQSEFPPQISITVKKTYESNKILTKYCYCGGCNINEKVTFKIAINKLDLISSENLVNISVIFSLNKNQCKHLEGKTFGQCRGLSRQKLMEFDCKSPRNIRKQILSTVKSEIRYTGNRQEGGSREILAKFAMRVWNSVRVKENIDEIENEIDRWEWLMIQKNLELINKRVSLIKKNRFRDNFGEISLHDLPSIDFESNQNLEDLDLAVYPQNLPLNSDKINNTWTYTIMGDPLLKIIQNYNSYELLILQLGININVQLDITTQSIINPFYSINLKNYLERFWWKTIILWSNLIPAIKNRTRRTTATVEVENNIVKNFDIGKKNLPIDEYIYVRTQTLKSTQNLIAERLMCRSFGQQNQDQNELNEQWQPKKKRTFTNEESRIIKNFKIVMDYRKNTDSPSQYRIAREIREISTQNIGFNQSM